MGWMMPMAGKPVLLVLSLFVVLGRPLLWGQERPLRAAVADRTSAAVSGKVPRLIQYSGALKDRRGQPLGGVQGVTFAFYKDGQDGAPLWLETQNVTADEQGRFVALLGATQPEGLDLDLFTSGQAQWLEVQAAGQEAQPRILLASVPYALVATSTEASRTALTLSTPESQKTGLSASAPSPGAAPANNAERAPAFEATSSTGPGLFVDATSGPPLQVASQTKVANLNADLLDDLDSTAFAKISGGNNFLGPQVVSTGGAANKGVVVRGAANQSQNLQEWQNSASTALASVSPSGVFTGSGAGLTSLNASNITSGLLAGARGGTGLANCADGQVLKWSGATWACGADTNSGGTITGVILSGTGLTGGGSNGNVTLSIDPSIIPKLSLSNTFTAPQSVRTGAAVQHLAAEKTEALSDSGNRPQILDPGAAATFSAINTDTTGPTYGLFGRSDSTGGYGGGFQNTTPSGKSLAAFDSTDNLAFAVLGSGSVGVGTGAPGYKLDVQGGQINASGGLCINGDCKAAWPPAGGTVTSVGSGPGLTGGPITGAGTLSFDTAFGDGRYAQLGAANIFAGTQSAPSFSATGAVAAGGTVSGSAGSFTGDVSAGGAVSGASANLGALTVLGTGSAGVGASTGLSRLTVRGKASFTATGTVSTDGTTSTVTGTGTKFLTEIGIGDRVTILATTQTVTGITDDTHLTVVAAFPAASGSLTVLPSLFRTDTSSGVVGFRVTDLGNVQIGAVANVTSKLLVAQSNPIAGTSTASTSESLPAITIRSTGSPIADAGPVLAFSGPNGSSTALLAGVRGAKENNTSGDVNGYLGFYTTLAGPTFAERMRLTSAGSLGIGVSNPLYKLDVQGGQINASGGLCMAGDCKTTWSAAAGAVTSLSAGTGLTASPNPIIATGTVSLDTSYTDARYAQLGAANNFSSSLTLTGGNLVLPDTTSASAGVITMGGSPVFHKFGSGNAFGGPSAGNFTMTGTLNTAFGAIALPANTTGSNNTAIGRASLLANNTGTYNTAVGMNAMAANTSGNQNTAVGGETMRFNTTGSGNTGLGQGALNQNTTGANNTASGAGALFSNTTGNLNTANGTAALSSNTTGTQNTATGQSALQLNTTGSQNTATGQTALQSNTTGFFNTATGQAALLSNTIGAGNTATGGLALQLNTTGGQNTATGGAALASNVAGSNNTADGNGALALNTGNNNTAVGQSALQGGPSVPGPTNSGSNNTAVGKGALLNNTADGNTAVGQGALQANTSGSKNAAVGGNALGNNQGGNNNTATGLGALFFNTGGSNNTAMGQAALFANTADGNTAMGAGSLQSNTSGTGNTATGQASLKSNMTGNRNTALGQNALTANTADNNTATGQNAMASNLSGCCNTAIGQAALNANTTGSSNTAVGGSALQNNQSGNGNTAVGQAALRANLGDFNTAVGQAALFSNMASHGNTAVGESALRLNVISDNNTAMGQAALGNTTGAENTAVGQYALNLNQTGNSNSAFGVRAGGYPGPNANTTGSNNTFLGFQAGPGTSAEIDNATAIGANALVSASNALVLGDSSVSVGIGTQVPAARLHVATGDVYVSNPGSGIILKSPNGSVCARLSLSDGGALVTTGMACP
jgi:hypothetical protein